MSMGRFSDNFTVLDAEKLPQLANILKVLEEVSKEPVRVVELDDNRLGLCIKIEVDSGSASPLRFREPIIIAVDKTTPEKIVPKVYPDRLDFPFEKIPHINYPHNGFPPSICLSREDDDEWYAEVCFREFVETVCQWFDDAANDRLIKLRNNDQYEPFRSPETNAVLFWFSEMDTYAENSKNYGNEIHDVDYKESLNIGKVLYGSHSYNKEAIVVHLSKPNSIIDKEWYVGTPTTLKQIYNLLEEKGYQFDVERLKQIVTANISIRFVYLAISVLRPTTIVGKNSKVDTICFLLTAASLRNNDLTGEVVPVRLFDQTTGIMAARLSDTPYKLATKKVLVLGAGAVGSKLIDHLYRGGVRDITICDNDIFAPHNVIRHTLSKGLSWKKKADLMKMHLEEMFMVSNSVISVVEDAVDYLYGIKNSFEYELVIDATASNRVMYALDELKLECPIVRCCLSNQGTVGLTYIVRKHDLFLQEFYMEILRLAIGEDSTSDDISKWIVSDGKTTLDRVRIGEGCHSNTMIVSDDTISAHVALSSMVIKQMFGDKQTDDELYLSFANYDFPGSMYSCCFGMPQYVTLDVDTSEWNVRIPINLLDAIHIKTKASGNKEVGGYLMGWVFEKGKTIWVIDTYVPKDSNRKTARLVLGTGGWKERLEYVQKRTGNQIIYLGDWHSHPNGTVDRSEQDRETFGRLKPELKGLGVCIITTGVKDEAYIINQ